MTIKYISPVLLVRDMQAARAFYEGLLGQKVQMDLGLNVSFEGTFALWEAGHAESIIFERALERAGRLGADNLEMYFESDQLDEVWQNVSAAGVHIIHPIRVMPWGQRVFRVYDPDGHIVEIAEPMPM